MIKLYMNRFERREEFKKNGEKYIFSFTFKKN